MQRVFYRAAGGVVVDGDRVLLLDRPSRGEVRLPKGHVEQGESPAQAALREVREETGYAHLKVIADLGQQQVEFVDAKNGRQVTRDETYFLMGLQDEHLVERESQEHQFAPMWVLASDAVARLTFAAEKEFVRRALGWIEQNGWPRSEDRIGRERRL